MTIPRQGLIATVVILVLAVVGIIIGVVISKSSSKTNSDLSSKPSTNSSNGSSKSTSSRKSTSTIATDPTSVTYSLAAFAIGDWTTESSCCERSSTYNNNYDVNPEDVVANVMNQQASAAEIVPVCVIGQGDSFYRTGINSKNERDSRFTTTFEGKLDGDNLNRLLWVNVMGNHDYGGADYICSDGDRARKCTSADDLLISLKDKFAWQATYRSPNEARSVLNDHFYVYTIRNEVSNVSIGIFNVDSGDADAHGAKEICCQCYGYAGGNDEKCTSVARGDGVCCGGDVDMFDKCMAQFTAWSDDSRKKLEASIANSTATWLVVNSHYSPYAHYAEAGMTKWFNIINGTGVHLWLNGHTHGEKHDYSSSLGVHFVDNGAGGGIQKESASSIPAYAQDYVKNLWVYDGDEYGFFSLTASSDWLKLQYHTADDKWAFASPNSTTFGGVATKHCWYVPNDGTEGQECTSMYPSS